MLFVDDASVAKSSHLTRRLHQPEKRGAVLTPDPALGEQWIQIRSAPWWVESEGRFALAYLSLRGEHCDTLLATSRDGVAWERPRFTRPGVEPANKVIVANARPKFFDPANIVFDPDDADPARRFKALVGAEGRLPAVSADGLSYRLTSERIINSSDESQLIYDRAASLRGNAEGFQSVWPGCGAGDECGLRPLVERATRVRCR